MTCLGIHFAIDQPIAARLLAFATDKERQDYVTEELEEEFFKNQRPWLAQTDKAWDWIHRALTDGELDWANGSYPLNHVILGGRRIYNQNDYVMILKSPDTVRDVSNQIHSITKEKFRESFKKIDERNLEQGRELDFLYAWEWFQQLPDFWTRAAEANRYILFTTDQ